MEAMFDTRAKIISGAEAVRVLCERSSSFIVVTGHFDPVVAAHVHRLEEIAGPNGRLFVIVLPPPDPILPQRARAELVAALRMVDHVAPCDEREAKVLLGCARYAAIVREESADLARRSQLAEMVRRRNNAG